MKTSFRVLTRELTGYFGFVLAFVLLILFVIASTTHLQPTVSPFSAQFGQTRGWLADAMAGFTQWLQTLFGFVDVAVWNVVQRILFGLSAYFIAIVPGVLVFLLVLARCRADDSAADEVTQARITSWGALFAEMLGTFVVTALIWAPAVGIAWLQGWLNGYNLTHLWIEIGILAGAAAIARGLLTRGFRTLFAREITAAFYSPIAYVVMCFLLIATGYAFFVGVRVLTLASFEASVVQAAFGNDFFWVPLLVLVPMITMRTYADEFRLGTFELVTTAPVRDWEVVAAKFCGALFFYMMIFLPSAIYFVLFQLITGEAAALAPGAYGGAYLLILLIGMLYISIGCLCSALTREQINAMVMSFVAIFGVFAISAVGFLFNVSGAEMQSLIAYFSSPSHMYDFSRGVIDTRAIVFYLSFTALALFLNYHVFLFRKWKA